MDRACSDDHERHAGDVMPDPWDDPEQADWVDPPRVALPPAPGAEGGDGDGR